ncbi:hypothetical protein AOLI_G00319550 [Acnodon oligacanthus]
MWPSSVYPSATKRERKPPEDKRVEVCFCRRNSVTPDAATSPTDLSLTGPARSAEIKHSTSNGDVRTRTRLFRPFQFSDASFRTRERHERRDFGGRKEEESCWDLRGGAE